MKTVKELLDFLKASKVQGFRIIIQDDVCDGLPYEVSHFSIDEKKCIVYIHFKVCSML